MEWFYKGKIIKVDEQGLFSYEHEGKCYHNDTLSGAKYWIDEQVNHTHLKEGACHYTMSI